MLAEKKDASLALVIGRFQPFHKGHERMCRAALEGADRLLVILGSARQAPSIRNPFSDAQREALIRASLPDIAPERLLFAGVPDVFYNEQYWLQLVNEAVDRHALGGSVTLYGHNKDSSSYYLALFPQWNYVELPNFQGLSATPQRDALLAAGVAAAQACLEERAMHFPAAGLSCLREQLTSPQFEACCEDYVVIQAYRHAWASAPYPPIFVTVDALVECGGKILLIQRGQPPGRGLWALPGGFLDQGERLQAGAERELREETGLDLQAHPHQCLAMRPYDAPERSTRGRFVTHLFHYRLDAPVPPAVSGGDDAAVARWFAPADIHPESLFEDHYCILQHALNWYP